MVCVHVAVVPRHAAIRVAVVRGTAPVHAVDAVARRAGRRGRRDGAAAGVGIGAHVLAAGSPLAVVVGDHARPARARGAGRRVGIGVAPPGSRIAGVLVIGRAARAFEGCAGLRVVALGVGALPFGAGPAVPAGRVRDHAGAAPGAIDVDLVHVDAAPIRRAPVWPPIGRRAPPGLASDEAEGETGRGGEGRVVAIAGRIAHPGVLHDDRRIRVTRAVHHGAVGTGHHAHVARRVAEHHALRGGSVHLHVGDVVQRRADGYGVDDRRHMVSHAPRPHGRIRYEPDSARQRVVAAFGLYHRHLRIGGVIQRRTLDGPQRRGAAGIFHLQFRRAARHRGGLRNGGGNQRLLGLRRARHRSQHARLRIL
ncbi:hypothetical protein ACAE110713_08700 [Achromobacter aegrifaciens]